LFACGVKIVRIVPVGQEVAGYAAREVETVNWLATKWRYLVVMTRYA
jgi:hypothetical protein